MGGGGGLMGVGAGFCRRVALQRRCDMRHELLTQRAPFFVSEKGSSIGPTTCREEKCLIIPLLIVSF